MQSHTSVHFQYADKILAIRIQPVTVWWSYLETPTHISAKSAQNMLIQMCAKEVAVQTLNCRAMKHGADKPVKVFECTDERTCRIVTHVIDDAVRCCNIDKHKEVSETSPF